MISPIKILLVALLLTIVPVICAAQCTSTGGPCSPGVPRFVKVGGSLRNEGETLRGTSVTIKFTIYDDPKAGNALWQEVQNVQVDAGGRYEVALGLTTTGGMPLDVFSSGEPRWLGSEIVAPGSVEEPRELMVSVPYSMEAADAERLGGLPASAYARAVPGVPSLPDLGVGTVTPDSGPGSAHGNLIELQSSVPSVVPSSAIEGRVGPVNVIPKFSGGGLASSQITDAGDVISLQNLSNTLFADRYAGGVPDAIAACPANGCIIYALSPNVNLNLGIIDPGTKAITIYLGPYSYSIKQIMLRKAMKIIGMGAAGGKNGSATCSTTSPCNGTTLQSINGNNPVFTIPQSNNTPVSNVLLSGFRLIGSAGNTSEDGFLLDTSSSVNSGLWYSTLDDIYLEGFAGIAIHIKGRNADFAAGTQWVLFNNVIAFRTSGGGNALRLEGAAFELRFRNCEFDGQAIGDGINIFLGGISGGMGGYPISIVFEGLVSQAAATAVQMDGVYNITFYASHHERLWGVYQIVDSHFIGARGVTITDSYFAGDVGANAGAGYELNVATTLAQGIVFTNNQMYGAPDAVIKGTNLASVIYRDNLYGGPLGGPPTSGITTQLSPSAFINTSGVHSVGLNQSTTPISTIQSSLGPGEQLVFFTIGGPVTFSSGGNIDLMGASSLSVNGTVTFMRFDLGGTTWKPISQWNSPSGAGATAQAKSRTGERSSGLKNSDNNTNKSEDK
jgi:hypothetical protein